MQLYCWGTISRKTTTDCVIFITVLHGFHVYHNTVNWNPYIGQNLCFKWESNNMHDKFAICGKALLPGKIVPLVVWHFAKELSRHIWFTIQKGAKVSAVVDNTKPKPLPLLQDGLETLTKMTVYWSNRNYIHISTLWRCEQRNSWNTNGDRGRRNRFWRQNEWWGWLCNFIIIFLL